jgi:hypothetical protein
MLRSKPLLDSFILYCHEHPSERFWQALRNWSGHNFIMACGLKDDPRTWEDTFYWNGRAGFHDD